MRGEEEARVKVRERKGEGRDRGRRECTHTAKAIERVLLTSLQEPGR